MRIIIEDRSPKDSVPANLAQLFKHILNCIYQLKIYHPGWSKTIMNQTTMIQKDIKNYGTKRIHNIIENCIDSSYKKGYNEFFVELHNSPDYKNNPYEEKEMRAIIPTKLQDVGKNTVFEKYEWTVDNIMNRQFIYNFLSDVSKYNESIYN